MIPILCLGEQWLGALLPSSLNAPDLNDLVGSNCLQLRIEAWHVTRPGIAPPGAQPPLGRRDEADPGDTGCRPVPHCLLTLGRSVSGAPKRGR